MRDPNVLIILTPGFASDENDTTCLPAQQLFVRSLNRKFPALKVIVLALQYPNRSRAYQWFGNTVIPINQKKTLNIFRPVSWIKCYKQIIRITRQSNVIGILSFWCQEAALIGNFFSRRNNIPHRIWILGQDAKKENKFVRWIWPDKIALVALSDFLADEFEKNHRIRPAKIVPNGIDETLYSSVSTTKDIDILGAGSLIRLKQYSLFLDVVERLARSHQRLKVVLIGNGPEKRSLEESIKSKNLSGVIEMIGEIPHPLVIKYMERSRVFLHPSAYEGYSTVCLEALFAGCEVISFTHAENCSVDHWHIVKDLEQMTDVCNEKLSSVSEIKKISVHTMNESAVQMMKLFNYAE